MVDFPDTPESNINAEKSLLGCVLLNSDVLDTVYPLVKGTQFHLVDLGKAYDAAWEIHNGGGKVDATIVLEKVAKDGEQEAWTNLLLDAFESVSHVAHCEYHARIVAENWQRRQIYYAASEIANSSRDRTSEVAEIIQRGTDQLGLILQTKQATRPLIDEITEKLNSFDAEVETGIKTGFSDIDAKVLGLRPGTVTILAARPSCGKTALACNMILKVAAAGLVVLFISLEQSRQELVDRFLSMRGRIDHEHILQQKLNDGERSDLVDAARVVSSLPIEVDDSPEQTMSEIHAKARMIQSRKGLGLVVIDYLQLVQPADKRAPREQQVASISRSMKAMAKLLHVPVISLAQLNRESEKREDKKPRISDLRESGAVEQDADLVWLLYRPGQSDKTIDQSLTTLIVAKNRSGQTCEVELNWDGSYMLFSDAIKAHPEQEEMDTNGYFSRF